MLAGFVIAILMNAPNLKAGAEKMPFGAERDFWLAIWSPLATVSETLWLDKPRALLDDALGRGDSGPVFELPTSPDWTPTATPTARPGETRTPAPTTTASPAPTATPSPTPEPPRVRRPTAENPLRIWIGGDSMSKVLGEAFVRQAAETGVMTATQESQLSSGLTRPDFFDWPGRFNDLVNRGEFEVYVVMFGANDSQGIQTPTGDIFQPGSDGWIAEYRRRVSGVMDLLRSNNTIVYWIGQPIMRDSGFSSRMAGLNDIYIEEAASRPWIRYIDMWEPFTTASGGYDAYITDDDGVVKLMRHPDGVHFVREGGEKAARIIIGAIRQEAGITAPAALPTVD
jgi:hypothetical protein